MMRLIFSHAPNRFNAFTTHKAVLEVNGGDVFVKHNVTWVTIGIPVTTKNPSHMIHDYRYIQINGLCGCARLATCRSISESLSSLHFTCGTSLVRRTLTLIRMLIS